jgi:hypothetical protein
MKAEGVFPMIKILAACGAGINSSHQIKTGIEEEMKKRGYDVKVDTMVMKDITEEILAKYDIFAFLHRYPNRNFLLKFPSPSWKPGRFSTGFLKWRILSLKNWKALSNR